jgi:hypothetical protein
MPRTRTYKGILRASVPRVAAALAKRGAAAGAHGSSYGARHGANNGQISPVV